MYFRYLDDILIIWNTSQRDPKELVKIFNGIEDKIKYTVETQTSEISFLDVRLFIRNGILHQDLIHIVRGINLS